MKNLKDTIVFISNNLLFLALNLLLKLISLQKVER